ncbi:uncharacterized protein LOC110767561 [Prunus avium]|uniref:Uncharacterized protein LOC110767561 n=1 Tax=Prunus avium TaxID=42229 RepID=A0A6P5THG2_PRUAV|nr:uncharacterized protein LOC110767561 [Prunus avium]
MKNKASAFLKQIMSVLSSIAKAKSLAIKSKTSAVKARLIMFSLVKNKKVLMDTVSHKIHSLLGHDHRDKQSDEEDDEGSDRSKALVLYNTITNKYSRSVGACSSYNAMAEEDEDEDNKYPDLRHSMFDEDENFDDVKDGGSVIDIVRNSKEEGEDFKLEDEIDQVADLFINRFHKQIRLQKLLSFKRYQEMLERSH